MSGWPGAVSIREVGPRDGLQNEAPVPTEAKVRLLDALSATGVRRIEAMGLDTYALEDRFYSYRRATHRIEPAYGRQLSLIGLAS